MAQGEYNHIEIPADDLARAQRFYSGVVGWSFTPAEGFPDYFLYRSGPGTLGGAIGKRNVTAPASIRNYITVDSIDATLPKVPEFGGKVVKGKDEIPGFGFWAVVTDSEGNEIGLFEDLPR